MSVLRADKLFIEPHDELTEVADRFSGSSFEHVILIVPRNSILLASILSLKILYRKSIALEKVVIVVTEDIYGQRLAQKAGFVTVPKVSQITAELWEIAQDKQERFVTQQHSISQQLLEERGAATYEANDNNKAPNEDVSVPDSTAPEKEVQTEVPILAESNDTHDQDEEDTTVPSEKDVTITDEFPKEESLDPQAKKKKVKGITLFQGGDVAIAHAAKHAKINTLDNLDNSMDNEREVDTSVFNENRFAGRDVTRMTGKQTILQRISSPFRRKKVVDPEDRFEPGYQRPWYQSRALWIVTGLFAFILLVGYLILFQFSQVTVVISLASEEVVATQTVELDTREEATLNLAQLRIPAREISVTESASNSATATGDGRRGERARGQVYIFNTSEEEIILPAGTKVTSVVNNLDYELVEETVLPAATEATDGTAQASRVDNITVEAVSYGEEYNIASSASTVFSIDGFDSGVLDVNRETAFEGGTEESFVSVSVENLDALKEQMLPELEQRIQDELVASVPPGFRLLHESILIEESRVQASPEVDQEARQDGDTYVFDLSIELSGQALIVREEDLEAIIASTLESDNTTSATLSSLTDIAIESYNDTNSAIFISISAQGEVVRQITEEDVTSLIQGKSLDDAAAALQTLENVSESRITYAPSFVPESLQRVPSSDGRITVRFE